MAEYCKNCKSLADQNELFRKELSKRSHKIVSLQESLDSLPTVPKVEMEECGECEEYSDALGVYDPTCVSCKGSGKVPVKCNCEAMREHLGYVRVAFCRKCEKTGYLIKREPKAPGDEVFHVSETRKCIATITGIKQTTTGWDIHLKFKGDTTSYWTSIEDNYADELSAQLLIVKSSKKEGAE